MAARNLTILMVDDDPDDFLLVKGALGNREKNIDLRLVQDGKEMLEYLRREGRFEAPDAAPEPCLILLDLNMPVMNGTEALQEIRNDPSLRHIPVVVFTTSSDTEDVMCCYRLGANSFLVKPASYDHLVSKLTGLMDYWEGTVELPLECKSRPDT
jgi:CheY-like chemotaxis protein